MSRTASCSCGQLILTMAGDPGAVTVCHCLECQKSTGSVFGVSSYWPKSAIQSIEGEAKVWRRSSASGRWLDNYFCPVCGSTVYWYAEFAPREIGIAAGNFADPAFPAPTSAVWDSCRHSLGEAARGMATGSQTGRVARIDRRPSAAAPAIDRMLLAVLAAAIVRSWTAGVEREFDGGW
ncbi:MAG TPA: GFA family protein [Dongiaceae bacterium]